MQVTGGGSRKFLWGRDNLIGQNRYWRVPFWANGKSGPILRHHVLLGKVRTVALDTMKISPSKFDIALAALGIGLLVLHAFLYILYLVLRKFRGADAEARKTDRPLWVAMIVSSGAFWILGSLQLYGIAEFIPSTRYSCVGLKYLLQYTLGYIFWISAVIYRMLRLFMVYTIISKRPLHAAAVVSFLLAPFVVLCLIAFGANHMTTLALNMCVQDVRWNVVLYSFCAAYFVLYCFLLIRLLTVIGRLKGMKTYIFLTGFSFIFVILDAILYLGHISNHIYRRVLVALIIAFVAGQTWIVFGHILIRPHRASADPEIGDTQKRLVLVEGANPLPPKLDLYVIQERARRRRKKRDKAKDSFQQALASVRGFFKGIVEVQEEVEPDDEVDERVPHYAVPDDFVFYSEAASTDKPRTGKFADFVEGLHAVDRERVDKNEGIYRVGNMYCHVNPQQVDMCLKYLGEPIEIVPKKKNGNDE